MNEQDLTIEIRDGSVPCSLHAVTKPRGVVLLGHGLGVGRHDDTVRRPASALNDAGFTVVVPELPLHGDRSRAAADWTEVVRNWQDFWATEGREVLLSEWRQIFSYVRQNYRLPVFYFGLSLGTQYGILFLAQTEHVRAAVLGLFGSEPLPKSKIMNLMAPKVSIPVYFIRKLDDEIHSAASAGHLFDSLGASVKVLDSTPGLHGEVSRHSIQKACKFLVDQIDA